MIPLFKQLITSVILASVMMFSMPLAASAQEPESLGVTECVMLNFTPQEERASDGSFPVGKPIVLEVLYESPRKVSHHFVAQAANGETQVLNESPSAYIQWTPEIPGTYTVTSQFYDGLNGDPVEPQDTSMCQVTLNVTAEPEGQAGVVECTILNITPPIDGNVYRLGDPINYELIYSGLPEDGIVQVNHTLGGVTSDIELREDNTFTVVPDTADRYLLEGVFFDSDGNVIPVANPDLCTATISAVEIGNPTQPISNPNPPATDGESTPKLPAAQMSSLPYTGNGTLITAIVGIFLLFAGAFMHQMGKRVAMR